MDNKIKNAPKNFQKKELQNYTEQNLKFKRVFFRQDKALDQVI